MLIGAVSADVINHVNGIFIKVRPNTSRLQLWIDTSEDPQLIERLR